MPRWWMTLCCWLALLLWALREIFSPSKHGRASLLVYGLLVGSAQAAPQDAVVRISSHGCSGTVIWSGSGKSYLLTCAHGFTGKDYRKAIVVDAPSPERGAKRTGGIRIIKIDYKADLCLIEMGVGPLPYVCAVAKAGHRPRRTWSAGYDEMKAQITVKTATILSVGARETYTREAPWHGRSGGALLDPDSGVLIGTVCGYMGHPGNPGTGIYTSHQAVLRFCGYATQAEERLVRPAPAPRTEERREWQRFPYYAPDGYCPDGFCPSPRGIPIGPP